MDILARITQKIIQEQEKIIGPIALEQAMQVEGLSVNSGNHEVKLEGDEKTVLENLVKKYESLFGRASLEVCKEAAVSINDKASFNELPDILKS
jgi:hypothetical protein